MYKIYKKVIIFIKIDVYLSKNRNMYSDVNIFRYLK